MINNFLQMVDKEIVLFAGCTVMILSITGLRIEAVVADSTPNQILVYDIHTGTELTIADWQTVVKDGKLLISPN